MIMKMMMIIDHNKKRKDINTRLGEGETLTKCGTVFFVNPQEFWGQTTLVFGTVEIRISLRFDKKYFARYHFRFVIFSLV